MNAFRAVRALMLVGLGVIAFSAFAACEFTVDLDPLKNGSCASGTKACNGKCVSTRLPDYGCAAPDSCFPCSLPHTSKYNCTNLGACSVSACEGTYVDCDLQNENGCEFDTKNDPDHCGSCTPAQKCTVMNGEPACIGGQCGIRICTVPFDDCDANPTDCETNTSTDNAHCGSCSTPCTTTQHCVGGACVAN